MNQSLTNLYHDIENYFFSGISSKTLEIQNNGKVYMTQVPAAELNFVYVTKPIKDLSALLDLSRKFYNKFNLEFVVAIPQSFINQNKENIISNCGYHKVSQTSAMYLDLNNIVIEKIDFSNIISTNNHLTDWIKPLIEAFESTYEISEKYTKAHDLALKKKVNINHFSLYKENINVSSVSLTIRNNLSRIDDLGTLIDYQNQGCATSLIKYCLYKAKEENIQYCFLEASKTGLALYKKLGFNTLFDNNIYKVI